MGPVLDQLDPLSFRIRYYMMNSENKQLSFSFHLSSELNLIRAQYIRLIKKELPEAAQKSLKTSIPWPVTEDHCFARILLDHLFQACWYDRLDKSQSAYKQLTQSQLNYLIQRGLTYLKDPDILRRDNRDSLEWRKNRK